MASTDGGVSRSPGVSGRGGRVSAWALCGAALLALLGTLLPWARWGAWGMPGLAGDGLLVALAALVATLLAVRGLVRDRPPGLGPRVLLVLAGALACVVSLAELIYLLGLALADAGASALVATDALLEGGVGLAAGAAVFPWEAFLFGLTWGRHVPLLASAPADFLAASGGIARAAEDFLHPGWGLVVSCLGSLGMLGTALGGLPSRR